MGGQRVRAAQPRGAALGVGADVFSELSGRFGRVRGRAGRGLGDEPASAANQSRPARSTSAGSRRAAGARRRAARRARASRPVPAGRGRPAVSAGRRAALLVDVQRRLEALYALEPQAPVTDFLIPRGRAPGATRAAAAAPSSPRTGTACRSGVVLEPAVRTRCSPRTTRGCRLDRAQPRLLLHRHRGGQPLRLPALLRARRALGDRSWSWSCRPRWTSTSARCSCCRLQNEGAVSSRLRELLFRHYRLARARHAPSGRSGTARPASSRTATAAGWRPVPAAGPPGGAAVPWPALLPPRPAREAREDRPRPLTLEYRPKVCRVSSSADSPGGILGPGEPERSARLALRPAEYAKLAYDRVAEDYDDLFGGHMTAINARLDQGLGLEPGLRVADLACGTGVWTLEMARAVAPGEVVGIDYSEGMLAEARERAERCRLERDLPPRQAPRSSSPRRRPGRSTWSRCGSCWPTSTGATWCPGWGGWSRRAAASGSSRA